MDKWAKSQEVTELATTEGLSTHTYICLHLQVNHSAVLLKLTQHYINYTSN